MVRSQIISAIREIKGTLHNISLLSTFLDSLLVFLIFFIAFMLLSLPWYWGGLISLIPFFIYFYYHKKKTENQLTLAYVEEKTPALKEELRTSADNLDKDNEIALALHEEVLAKMKYVNVSDFIDFRKISRRLMVIAMLCFLILIFSAYHVKFLDLNDLLDDFQQNTKERNSPYKDEYEEENRAGTGSSIFGEESIAELGSEELDLQINLVQSEIDINQVKDPQQRSFTGTADPNAEIQATIDEASQEKITEHKDLIKAYYREIAKT